MTDLDKLGVFYLGRPRDPAARAAVPEPLLYDAKDLTTHAPAVDLAVSQA